MCQIMHMLHDEFPAKSISDLQLLCKRSDKMQEHKFFTNNKANNVTATSTQEASLDATAATGAKTCRSQNNRTKNENKKKNILCNKKKKVK